MSAHSDAPSEASAAPVKAIGAEVAPATDGDEHAGPQLVAELRASGLIKTHRKAIFFYSNTFTAADVVAHLMARERAADPAAAAELAQRLLFRSGLAHAVADDSDFSADSPSSLYRLLEDEPPSKRGRGWHPAGPLIASLGEFEDVAHDEAAHARAAAAATSSRGAFYSKVYVKGSSCLGVGWAAAVATVGDTTLRLYRCASSAAPLAVLTVSECMGHVGEVDQACKPGNYCLRIEGRDQLSGTAASLLFCVRSSKEQQLWLQALSSNGLKYEENEEPPATTTLHELSAAQLDGRHFEMAEHRGRVLLVVNVASK